MLSSLHRLESKDDDEEAWDAEVELISNIKSCISSHHLPILALGSGRGALSDKYLCVLHGMFLEAGGSAASLKNYTNSFVVGTFDLGTEFSLNTIRPEPIHSLLPWASFPEDTCEGRGDEHDFDIAQATASEESISLQSMLAVPGPMHVLHNATSSLMDAVPYLNTALEGLTALSKFLALSTTSQRLVATCFSCTLGQVYKRKILGFRNKVHLGRWGTLSFSVPALLELEVPLRRFWSLQKYRFKSELSRERDPEAEAEAGHLQKDHLLKMPSCQPQWAQPTSTATLWLRD